MKKLLMVATAILLCFMTTGCRSIADAFTNDETVHIKDLSKGEIMKLWTIDRRGDSLFLSKSANAVSLKLMRSETFALLQKRMLATVQDPNNPGVGIAAPQVGISRRLIAVQRFDKEGQPFEFFANPVITYYSDEKSKEREGCLSVPGRWGLVERSQAITIEYDDPDNLSSRIETISGFTAIIFQHEIDHLNGILYIDKCDELVEEKESEEAINGIQEIVEVQLEQSIETEEDQTLENSEEAQEEGEVEQSEEVMEESEVPEI